MKLFIPWNLDSFFGEDIAHVNSWGFGLQRGAFPISSTNTFSFSSTDAFPAPKMRNNDQSSSFSNCTLVRTLSLTLLRQDLHISATFSIISCILNNVKHKQRKGLLRFSFINIIQFGFLLYSILQPSLTEETIICFNV